GAEFRKLSHPEAYTAQEMAAAMHVPGGELAKVVMIKAGKRFIMAVLPASLRVDFGKLRDVLGEDEVALAAEDEFKTLFPDCEPGAEPPFGNLYDIETMVESSLAEDESIVFNAGSHTDAVEMDYAQYEGLVKPRVAEFGKRV
ncbi:MAG: YbaK/EbsC family protein, partial [Thermodesulfobacteriota bacterium]